MNVATVVALGSGRPVGDIERTSTDRYAPQADNEFDLMDRGIVRAFGHDGQVATTDQTQSPFPNLSSAVRRYPQTDGSPELVVLRAPSHDKDKWANTADTMDFLTSVMDLPSKPSILVVTTSIHVPFQHADAVRDSACELEPPSRRSAIRSRKRRTQGAAHASARNEVRNTINAFGVG